MESRPASQFWRPKLSLIAVLDSDEYLADALCGILLDSGFTAVAFYDISSLMNELQTTTFRMRGMEENKLSLLKGHVMSVAAMTAAIMMRK